MRSDTISPQIDGSGEAWSEIESLVDETARLARMPMSNHEFHQELVKRLVRACNARTAAIWCLGQGGQLAIEAQIDSSLEMDAGANLLATRSRNVTEAAREREPKSLAPHQSDSGFRNPSGHTLLLHPVLVDKELVGVIEAFHDAGDSSIEAKNAGHLVSVFAELAEEFHRNRLLRELLQRESTWSELEQFVDHVHRSLDLKRTAFAIANEAARAAGCDQVIVFHRCDAVCRTLSISGLESFDRRSTQLRAAEQLARAVADINEPLWYAGEIQSLPAQLERCLQSCLDSSPIRSLAAVPLGSPLASANQEVVGVLLFARFERSDWSRTERRRVEFICRHAATALSNANELSGLPLIGASRFLQWCLGRFALRRLPKTVAVLSLLAIAIAALMFIPADFDIRGEGQLLPTRYRHVFAPADGVIDRVYVRHAESVDRETPLLEMRRPDLDYEESRLLGEILTTQKRWDTIRAALLNHKPAAAASASEFHELTSEEARLQVSLTSLRSQQAILQRERAELTIRSPLDGEVLTWGIEDDLSLRPVRRGERLLSVADPRGPWQLEMRIADHDIEHVLAARRETNELAVSFILTSQAGETHLGTVEEIAMATELDEHDQPTVLVRVAVDRDQLPDLRPGTSVVADVHCGRRSIGYVWLRELMDVIRTRVLF